MGDVTAVHPIRETQNTVLRMNGRFTLTITGLISFWA
jgi:hypothetical protein